MGPQLKASTEVGIALLKEKERPYTISPIDFFTGVEQLKSTYAQLIELDEANRIALAPSASYGFANIAQNIDFEAGDEIILTAEQFPSNVYCWQKQARKTGATITFVAKPNSVQPWTSAILDSITEKTKVVSMGQVHWADGSLFDLIAIRKRCDEVGAYLLIDGTQSVGALPFSIKAIQPDALVVSSYKWLLGTYGLCLTYMGPKFDQGQAIEESWINRHNSEDFTGLVNYEDRYKPMANRYIMGQSSSFVYVGVLQHALEQLLEWGTEKIQSHGKQLKEQIKSGLAGTEFFWDEANPTGNHLWALKLPKTLDVAAFKAELSANNIYLSIRGQYARVACHLYNDDQDVAKLLQVLSKYKS